MARSENCLNEDEKNIEKIKIYKFQQQMSLNKGCQLLRIKLNIFYKINVILNISDMKIEGY